MQGRGAVLVRRAVHAFCIAAGPRLCLCAFVMVVSAVVCHRGPNAVYGLPCFHLHVPPAWGHVHKVNRPHQPTPPPSLTLSRMPSSEGTSFFSATLELEPKGGSALGSSSALRQQRFQFQSHQSSKSKSKPDNGLPCSTKVLRAGSCAEHAPHWHAVFLQLCCRIRASRCGLRASGRGSQARTGMRRSSCGGRQWRESVQVGWAVSHGGGTCVCRDCAGTGTRT